LFCQENVANGGHHCSEKLHVIAIVAIKMSQIIAIGSVKILQMIAIVAQKCYK